MLAGCLGIPAWREKLYAFMTPNAVGASEYFQILSSRIIELGIQVFDFALQRR
jgi:K+ transporter